MEHNVSRRQFLAGAAAVTAAAAVARPGRAVAAPATPAATGDWWAVTPRSGRPWASGTTYWPVDSLDDYDRLVGLSDGGGGASKGTDDQPRAATWNDLAGGPPSTPGQIAAGSHLDWSSDSATNFGAQYNYLPPDKAWLCWVFPSVPTDPAARGPLKDPTGGTNTVWHKVAGGQYDQYYLAMGKRIRANLDARGIDPNRFIGRPNHEMNQSNTYQVFPATRAIYKSAMDHTVTVIRQGAGFPLHMAHAPALGEDIGPYLSYCPSKCDLLSISYHPSNTVTDLASWNRMIYTGTATRYPVSTLFDAADSTGKPIAFLEWSPRYEAGQACPIADKVYQWTHDLFAGQRDRLVVDLVHSQRTLDPDGYEGTDTAGRAAWRRGVAVYEELWSGRKP